MARDETIVKITDERGVITGRIDPAVFKLANVLPGAKRWVRGELWFAPTEEHLVLIRKHLVGATWQGPVEEVTEQRPLEEIVVGEHEFRRPPIGKQLEAFTRAKDRDEFALFMWMGTGKTFVALNLAAHWWRRGLIDRVLVTAPKGVDKQWLDNQLPEHMPDWCPWHAALYRSGKDIIFSGDKGLKWLFMNIESWSVSGQAFALDFVKGGRTLVIIDESTRIKSASANRSKFAVKLGKLAVKRLILSGLPVTRSVEDLFMQFNFLNQAILGFRSIYGFKARYCVLGGWQNRQVLSYQNIPDLLAKIEPHCIIAPRAPGMPMTIVQREHDLSVDQRRMYSDIKTELMTFLKDHQGVVGQEKVVAVAHAGAALIKLQQITNGYIEDKESGELHLFSTVRSELCADIIEEGGDQKKLIFCRFHQDLELVSQELTKREITWGEYSGRNVRSRDEYLNALRYGELENLVMTAASGGVGLDIPQASMAIYFSNSFDYEHREQSRFRMDRLGQKRSMTIVDLIGSPIDKLMLKSFERKKGIGDLVLSLGEEDL